MKSKGTAYLLWLISIFGWLGFHHFYLGKIFKGLIWIFTGGVFGIGSLIDLFTLGGQVENYNTKQELNTIRAASLANLALQKKKSIEDEQKRQIEEKREILSDDKPIKNEFSKPVKKDSPFLPIINYLSSNRSKIIKFGLPIIAIVILVKLSINFLEPDFSDPKKVIEKTEQLWRKGDFKTYYKYLSESSKSTYKSYDDYFEKRNIPDSTLKTMKPISIEINEIPMTDFEDFKRFEIIAIDKNKDKIDTSTYYRTVFNENGKWKLVWNRELLRNANELSQKGDFTKSAEICNQAIKLDPFSVIARTQLVWCYLRDAERPDYWEDSTVYHLNFVLELDSTNGDIFNTIGAYYSNRNENKKAVNNFLLAAEYYKDSSSIANAYSNASQNSKNYDVTLAEQYLEMSLKYNEKSRFAWQTFGDLLYSNQKYSRAKEKYLNAIELVEKDKNLDNHTLISLYGQYALTCKKLGLKDEAEEYILKCIRVYPDKKHPIFKELNL
jgi:Tfp pilus assembly protein PilF